MARKEGDGGFWYEVTGVKPERWVVQTNFDNDEAVGYLADRLAKLGVEDELRRLGAKPGDEVRIGKGQRAVSFDWDPTIAAGAEMLDALSWVPAAAICVLRIRSRAAVAVPMRSVVVSTTR